MKNIDKAKEIAQKTMGILYEADTPVTNMCALKLEAVLHLLREPYKEYKE